MPSPLVFVICIFIKLTVRCSGITITQITRYQTGSRKLLYEYWRQWNDVNEWFYFIDTVYILMVYFTLFWKPSFTIMVSRILCHRVYAVAACPCIIYLTFLWNKWPSHGYTTQYISSEDYDNHREMPSVKARTFPTFIKNKKVCSGNELELIIFICSSIDNFNARNALRKTWLSEFKRSKGKYRYVFIIGKQSRSVEFQMKLKHEYDTYEDILQGDFIDSYRNLTLKTIAGLEWVSQNCNQAKLVMKIDDDVYLHFNNLMAALDLYKEELQTSVGGYCVRYGYPERNPTSKFYFSYEDYPHDTYPPYCSGTAYVTSLSVAKQLYAVSKDVKLFPFEDVFIGLCLVKLKYGWTQIPGFAVEPTESTYCKIKRSTSIITLHSMTPSEIMTMWESTCMHYQVLLYVGGINIMWCCKFTCYLTFTTANLILYLVIYLCLSL